MDLFNRFWIYVQPYIKYAAISIAATLVVSATSGAMAWLVKPILDEVFVAGNSDKLLPLAIGVLVIFACKGMFSYVQSYSMQYASWNIMRDIRNDVFKHTNYMPLSEYQKTSTGMLISKVITDITQMNLMGTSMVKVLIQQSFTLIGLLVVVVLRDWKMGVISLVVFPLTGFFVNKYGRRIRNISRKSRESIGQLVNILQEVYTGTRIIKTFTNEELEYGKFERRNNEFTGLMIKTERIASRVAPVIEIMGGVAVCLIIIYGGGRVIKGEITTGDFFSFLTAMGLMYTPVKALGNLNANLQKAMAAAERVFELIDTETERDAMDRGRGDIAGVDRSIEYKDVTFTYNTSEGDVLKGVDLTVKKGEVVALVGSSGSGKTTLVNLLPRFHEVSGGGIYIDGVNIKEFALRPLRKQIAIVTQDTILFNDTIRNNIAYSEKTYTDEEVSRAAVAAYAERFIVKLPDGYDTVIGEKGARLSGGEKQRISIARAILKDSPILILDEATSSLDTESERMVQNALENLMKDRTTLVIAHRLSTIINADKIVVMDRGRIMGTGRHDELLKSNDIYRKLYNMQFSVPVAANEEAD